ncbi:MAG: signal peptide peptidase SppA [Planctomycetales bacterium]|nr:signal peptide peptidase SppA [Planctomycetales bacterium]
MKRTLWRLGVIFGVATAVWGATLEPPTVLAQDAPAAAQEPEQQAAESKPAENPASQNGAPSQGAETKPAVVKKVRLAHIVISGSLPESPGQMSLFGDLGIDLRKNVARLDKAAEDDSVQGVILQIDVELPRGKLNELRAAVQRVRNAGKKVYASLESAQGNQYLLAAACDEITMPESGIVIVPGVRAEFAFYKNLFAKLGVEADMIHCGDYKGAAEPYTRDSLSEPVRENMTALIDDLFDQMVAGIAADRNLPVDQTREAVDRGLLTANEAKAAGLIDDVAYPDELRKRLQDEYRAEELVYVQNYAKQKIDVDFSGPMGMMKMFQTVFGGSASSRSDKSPKIALIYAVGPIVSGKSQSDLFGDTVMGSTTLVEAVKTAGADDSVKAVVLRVNSPGGSALASDLIWRALESLDKPLVVSMGDVAASGGYYISMGADRIFAEPGTVTGSIGVVGGKIAVQGLFDKLGVTTESITRGKNAGIFSTTEKFSDSEREAVERMMNDIYLQFRTKAAAGRGMSVDELTEHAGGRVFTGRVAKRLGLIDEIGTLKDALIAAKRQAGFKSDEKVQLMLLPKPQNPLEELLGADANAEREARSALVAAVTGFAPDAAAPLRQALQVQQAFKEPVAAILPYWFQID